jgi:protein-disulfide isomerase
MRHLLVSLALASSFLFSVPSFAEPFAHPSLGDAAAPVVIEEFVDFQCPFCARGAQTMKQLLALYPTQVRLVYRAFPLSFHPRALPAAIAGACANRQGKFWPLYETMFANQQSLTDANIRGWLSQDGGDLAAFDACVASGDGAADVQFDLDETEKRNILSTPTFFINGKKVSGALPLDDFKKLVDEALGNL